MSVKRLKVSFSYLDEQFADPEPFFEDLRTLVATGDFTLGKAVEEFETQFADWIGAGHAIGVNSGTDAICLSLLAAGIGPGDEVITAANTFIATVGAINETGAQTVFVDVDDSFCMDPDQFEGAIGPKTKAVIPVHLTGNMGDIPRVVAIASESGITVVEDACQGIGSRWNGKSAGTWGSIGTFSLHPLKFLNIWGDGGIIVTDDPDLDRHLRLLRNHGLVDRDTVVLLGRNSRLDTLQAVIASRLLRDADTIIKKRAVNSDAYKRGFANIPQVVVPHQRPEVIHSFVTYQIFAEDRDGLLEFCGDRGIETKIHYPVPVYRQAGLKHLGYSAGDFPVTDRQAATVLTLPVHQYLTRLQTDYVIETIREYYGA